MATRFVVCSASGAAAFPSDSFPKTGESPANNDLPRIQRKQRLVAGVDQNNLVDPWMLADRDSRFAEFFNVQLHYKIAHPPSGNESTDSKTLRHNGEEVNKATTRERNNLPAVLLHGFGASLFSWQRVLKQLAAIIDSSVVAFDRPGFGLTSRPKPLAGPAEKTGKLNPYSVKFSAKAALSFAEFLHSEQVILIGHSAGCLVAFQAYLDAPEKVAAMVFIAPAIAAPIVMGEIMKATSASIPGNEQLASGVDPSSQKKFRLIDIVSAVRDAIWWIVRQVLKALQIITAAVQALFQMLLPENFVKNVGSGISSVRDRLVTAVIRSSLTVWLVRVVMDRFGTTGVRMAWYDPFKADDIVLQGYTKPLQCKDWDKALLEFVLAMAVSPSASMDPKNPLGKRLKEVTCPVLVVTGDTDRLVPGWNARRLADALPNAEFALIKKCGHLPQEETPDELLTIIERFIAKTFASKPL